MGPLERPRSCNGSSEKASGAREDDPYGVGDQDGEGVEDPQSRVWECGGRLEGLHNVTDLRR